jgi:16S rRNA (adenine(1408)-N(1))-methyltransferase
MPEALVLGIDPDAAALRERSAAAARRPERGGLPNAVFLVGSAERLPAGLLPLIDELWVTLPWGCLLRGAAGPRPWFLDLLLRLPSAACARLVLSVVPTDHLPGLPQLDADAACALGSRYADAGLTVREIAPVTAGDVAALGSSWAKRLGIPVRRAAWRLVLSSGSDELPA